MLFYMSCGVLSWPSQDKHTCTMHLNNAHTLYTYMYRIGSHSGRHILHLPYICLVYNWLNTQPM